ncbi:MAG: hypothetical protein IJZ26_03215 [Clostridia bacterium]|nr:hypothetical protein [Clostridia bacterium]
MKNKIFGTDGIRGIANTQVSANLAFNIAKALAIYIINTKTENEKPKVILGCDTRKSCHMLTSAMCAGLTSMGVNVTQVGIVPTPAVGYLTKEFGFDFGIMVTASHNSKEYNGIKIINKNGLKLTDEQQEELTKIFEQVDDYLPCLPEQIGVIKFKDEYQKYWADYMISCINCSLNGLRIGLDCAFGASYKLAPYIFKKMGAVVECFNCEDKGEKINLNCGANNPQFLEVKLKEEKLDIAFAFDGDADRVVVVTSDAYKLKGDEMLYLIAKYFKQTNDLKNNIFATTILTNYGLDKSLTKLGINVERVAVGDRSLQKIMCEQDILVGGEDNGHIILGKYDMGSNGLLCALFLSKMLKEGMNLKKELEEYKPFTQVKIDVNVSQRQKQLCNSAFIKALITELEQELEQNGRIIVRPSGTEMVIRILVEGINAMQVEKIAKELENHIKKL